MPVHVLSTTSTPPPTGTLLRQLAAHWPAGLCLGLSLLMGSALQNAHQERSIAEQRHQLEGKSLVLRDRLQAVATRSFSPTTGLTTLIQVDGKISQERFSQLIDRSLDLVPFLRSVVAAPDDVARYVYPLAGNERVLNLDYRSIAVQWEQILQVRALKAPRLYAPVKLIQGGVGVIQRTPLFLRDGPTERYWGVLSVVLDLDRFVETAGLTEDPALDVALFAPRTAGEPDTLVWGTWAYGASAGVTSMVQLPGAQWTLKTHPHAGWAQAGLAREALAVWLGGALVALLAALLVRQAQHLRQGNDALSREMDHVQHIKSALEDSQNDLLAARDRLQAVLDAATEVAIVATDLQGRITVFNLGAQRMLGYTAQAVMGQTPALWHLQSEVQAMGERLHRGAQEAAPEGFEVFVRLAHDAQGTQAHPWTFKTARGDTLQVSLAMSPMHGPTGAPIGYLGVARDLSDQRKAESALRQLTDELETRVTERTAELHQTLNALQHTQEDLLRSEKLAALGALVAGVAHELNTPIGNCLTTASALQDRTTSIVQLAQQGQMKKSVFDTYLRDTQEASGILLRGLSVAGEMVQHFKQLAADQTSEQRRVFTVKSVVDDVLSLMRASWKATPFVVESDIQVDTTLDSYPGALGRVIGNLMQNALLHGFEGRSQGRFKISARALSPHMVELQLEDDGCGMGADVRRRAFDPFFTTKLGRGGSGLGLNIVYNTVTGVLGGSVDLHSTPGVGSRFVLRIPVQAPYRQRE